MQAGTLCGVGATDQIGTGLVWLGCLFLVEVLTAALNNSLLHLVPVYSTHAQLVLDDTSEVCTSRVRVGASLCDASKSDCYARGSCGTNQEECRQRCNRAVAGYNRTQHSLTSSARSSISVLRCTKALHHGQHLLLCRFRSTSELPGTCGQRGQASSCVSGQRVLEGPRNLVHLGISHVVEHKRISSRQSGQFSDYLPS